MNAPFYRGGLRFACHQCGHCCTGEPGYVYVDERESRALADWLGLDVAVFYQTCLRRVPSGLSLLERADGSCVFYDGGCTVYGARPKQCRTYPFWPDVLGSERRWNEEARRCPGIGEGPLFDVVSIEALLRSEGSASTER
jgi:uncharacterized protein